MLIVLEGCDGTGKTTLANHLSKLLDAEIIHCSTNTPNDFEFFEGIIECAKNGKNIIADRFCYGQFIYQDPKERPLATYSIFTDHNKSSWNNLYELERMMLESGAKLVFVTASNETIKKRLGARSEVPINGLSIEEIQNRYADVRKKSMLTWLEYNTEYPVGGENLV